MRTRNLRLAHLLSLALLALAAARPATGQPCTITCPADVTVTATGVLTPVSFRLPSFGGACEPGTTVTCSPGDGSDFPVGTTAVSCGGNVPSGGVILCQFNVNVVAPTDASFKITDVPVTNPNLGSSQSAGASDGQFDVFYSSTGVFNVYEEGAFTFAISAQGFVAYNCAQDDEGISCLGAKADGLNIAKLVLCGENQASLNFIRLPDQNFDLTAGIFINGNSTDTVCGGTPGGKVFQFNSGRHDDPFFFANMPAGSRVQEIVPFGRGCAALGTGRNGMFFFSRYEPSSFTDLPFTPDSATARRTGNIFVTNAIPKLLELEKNGTVVASYDLPNRIFRMNTFPPDNVVGFVPPRNIFAWSPTFKKGLLHTIFGSGSNVVDFKAAPGGTTIVSLNDPTVGRTFPRRLTLLFEDNLTWTKGIHRVRFGGEWCHQTVIGR